MFWFLWRRLKSYILNLTVFMTRCFQDITCDLRKLHLYQPQLPRVKNKWFDLGQCFPHFMLVTN